MADQQTPQPVASIPRTTRPMSEALLNEKWDRCLSSMLIRSGLGVSFGVVFSVLLFKRRAWPAFVGLGFGAGRAWEECDNSFKRAAAPPRDGLRVVRP
ncbi:Mitochondrial inner membrane organizing system component [Plenodomus lindquistii]|nr:Mitochondrial inner membrane organizing system component [Plenodomus lindquistii]